MFNYFSINLFFYFMFFSGLIAYCFMHKHMLITLLCLDYISISLFCLYINYMIDFWGDFYMIVMFLVFVVCEAVLGLSILVGVIRCHGNDYSSNLFIMW